jgi:hypothetical protein
VFRLQNAPCDPNFVHDRRGLLYTDEAFLHEAGMRFIVLIEASHCVAEPPAAQAHIAIDVEDWG